MLIVEWSSSYIYILQDDDAVNAEAFINKASFLVSSSQNEVLNLQYKVHSFLPSQSWFLTVIERFLKHHVYIYA